MTVQTSCSVLELHGMHLTQLLVHHYLVMCWWWPSIEGITDSLVTYCSRIMACMDMNMVKHLLSGHVYMYKMWTQFTPPFNYTTLVRCLVIKLHDHAQDALCLTYHWFYSTSSAQSLHILTAYFTHHTFTHLYWSPSSDFKGTGFNWIQDDDAL